MSAMSWPAGVLNRDKTLEVLTQHNAWRRGVDGPQTDPRMLGLALDAAIAALSAPAVAVEPVAVTDEAIERALDTKLGLDHTLRQLVLGGTGPVGYSKVDVVRTLLSALAAATQESPA